MRLIARPGPTTRVVLAAALVMLGLMAAVPALAKEFLEARLDAPITFDSPPGAELLVGVTLTTFEGPATGQPMYLKLIGRDGATTRAAGAADGPPGHYLVRIEVPAGGVRDLEIGLHGSSDLPVMMTGRAFTFGPISDDTAQLAPPDPAAATAAAVATRPFAAPFVAAPALATADAPAVRPAEETSPAAILLGALLVAGFAAGLAARAVRNRRRAEGARIPDRASGG